nr:ABC transporter ATP-binding protein [Actinomycetales bacterium]
MNDTPVVQVSGLTMAYGDNLVLNHIDLTVQRGEVVVLLGPNGAGKTTTVEILEGFRRRSSGQVLVLGADPERASEAWRARVGMVLQSWRDHAKWKVHELIDYLGAYYAPYSTPTTRRPWPTAALLETVGLADDAQKKVSQLSGGRRRRLDVAAGLVGRPELLFLDEPTAGFDPIARRDFHDLILSLADLDTTILMTTHDLDEAGKVADRILILADSRIVADGSPDELRRLEFGASEVRWFDGETRHVHAAEDPTDFLRGMLRDPDTRVEELEIRRTSLEDVYIALVNQAEGVTSNSQDQLLRRLRHSMDQEATS